MIDVAVVINIVVVIVIAVVVIAVVVVIVIVVICVVVVVVDKKCSFLSLFSPPTPARKHYWVFSMFLC